MSISRLPNGRYRVQVYDPTTKTSISAAKVLGLKVASFRTKAEAKSAREQARAVLKSRVASPDQLTVRGWWDIWTTHPQFQRPKESSNIIYREMTSVFVRDHAHRLLSEIDRRTASAWVLQSGKTGHVKFLRTMFSDAMDRELIASNPFARMGLGRGKGNARKQPPTVGEVQRLIDVAWAETPPGFAALLQVGCFTGLRTCELDALAWDSVDWDASRLVVDREYCSRSNRFDAPKNSLIRRALLTPPAREALERVHDGRSEFCFVNTIGGHWTRQSRKFHWDRVRELTGWTGSMYLSTRHFFGWYAINELGLSFADVASAMGHTDRGELVRLNYGHFDDDRALDRVAAAFDGSDWRQAA